VRCSVVAFTNFPHLAPAPSSSTNALIRQHQLMLHSSSSTSAVTAAATHGDKDETPDAALISLPLPVGIFVDLDNIQWSTYSRADAKAFVRPFEALSQRMGGKIVAFQAFGNRATQTWRPPQERERFAGGGSSSIDSQWDPRAHHSGYDEDDMLRCGICGARMKLSKKDRARGWDMEHKLNKHMKMLHDREQNKRINRAKASRKKKKLNEKDMQKFQKYKAAQIDTGRRMGGGRNNNQLFAILKEVGVRCYAADDVDAALMKNARQWMGGGNGGPASRTKLTHQQELMSLLSKSSSSTVRGCLMVVSNDSDFCELLEEARRRGYLVVSVTLEEKQTRALENVSDLVFRAGGDGATIIPNPMTRRGAEFMLHCEERWKKDHALSPLGVWDLNGTNDVDDKNDKDRDPSGAEESDDDKEDLGKDSSSQKAPVTQQTERQVLYFRKILEQYPELDIANRDDAKRLAAFTKLLSNTKKKDRLDRVRSELRIRLYQRVCTIAFPNLPKPVWTGLHWFSIGLIAAKKSHPTVFAALHRSMPK